MQGDLNDPASVTAALDGIDSAVLILRNGIDQERLELSFINAAKEAGLPWIIKLSSPEAVRGTTSPIPLAHIAAEDAIMALRDELDFRASKFLYAEFAGRILAGESDGQAGDANGQWQRGAH